MISSYLLKIFLKENLPAKPAVSFANPFVRHRNATKEIRPPRNNGKIFHAFSTSLFFHSSNQKINFILYSAGPLTGLIVMAIACGNIKPCMAAFGGDQFNQKDVW